MIRGFGIRRHGELAPAEGPGPESLFADLFRARDGVSYHDQDRRRDFQLVFRSSAAGKRVLQELFTWTHMFASTFVPGDAYATHWREGSRDMGLRLLAVLDGPRSGRPAGHTAEDTEKGA